MPYDHENAILPFRAPTVESHMPSAPHQPLRHDWRKVLARLMEEHGLSKRALSMRAGLNETAVSEWLRQTPGSKPSEPSFQSLASVAQVLRVSLDVFTIGAASLPASSRPLTEAHIGRAPVVGCIEAGAWRETMIHEAKPDVFVPLVPRPEFRDLPQVAWEVAGASADRVARPGEYMIGVSFTDLGRAPRHGDYVVIDRRYGELHERTARRIVEPAGEGGMLLMAESDDVRFAAPVTAGPDIAITHLVIGVYRDLA